jgi:protein-L-isoaspartate O-methyltransferase
MQHSSTCFAHRSDRIAAALLACPRELFIPPEYRDEALFDTPIRVEAHGFNISAPHMHALALESMQLEEGDR